MFSVDGLISGLDTTAIVEGALSLQQARADRLRLRKQEIADEQTVFKTIEGQLLGLKGSLGSILRSSNNAFDGRISTSSDEEAVAVSASSQAAPGVYKLRVTQLAQAHQVKSNTFAARSEEISTGSLSIRVGNRAEATIIIDPTNNTLQGLADAINAGSRDVTASIVDDGSNSDQPLRLLLSSRFTGEENEIQITNGLGFERRRGGGKGIRPDFSGPAVQEALNAQVQIGSGEGAIIVSSATNQFEDLFDGLSFDALRADPDKELSITVAEDKTAVTDAIEGFVDSYNQVIDFIDSNSQFDPETNAAGILLGNRSAAVVQSKLRAALSTVIEGVNDNLSTLPSLGISTNSGKLVLDRSKLQDIIEGNVEGLGIQDIRRLFAIDGRSDNPGIEFLLGTKNSQASPRDPESGELIPYEIEINRSAAAAALTSNAPLSGSTVIDGINNRLSLEVDGTEISVVIPPGTYASTALADQLQALINASPDRNGREVRIATSAGSLVIESASVGSSSRINILGGSANQVLGFSEGESAIGSDVAGVFRVPLASGTITEQAVGNGRILSGNPDNEYTAQLQVRSRLSENQIAASTDARLTVTRGIGAALDAAISDLMATSGGELTTNQDRFNREIDSIDDDIDRVETQLELRRDSLLREFAALESTLAELQSVGSALSSLPVFGL